MYEEGKDDSVRLLELASVDPLLTRSPSLSWLECSTTLFQRWRYGSSMNPGWNRAAQA
jgi:hypothetical protein